MTGVGATLKAIRTERGVSLDRMAELTHYSKSTLSLIERGKRTVLDSHIEAYEQALGSEGLSDEMQRRALLKAIAGGTAGAASEPLSRLLEGVSSERSVSMVGATEVAAVQESARQYSEMDLRFGGTIASEMASGALKWSVSLLDGQMGDDTRRALFSAVASLSDRVAWSHHDAGNTIQVRRLSQLAVRTSTQGNDPTLAAHVRLNVSSFMEDQPLNAAEVLSGVSESKRVHPMERANCAAVRARHLGIGGKQREARNLLAMAEDLALTEAPDAPPEWANFLTYPHLSRVFGRSYHAIGDLERSASAFERAASGFGPDRARGRGHVLVRLGHVYVDQGRTEEAGECMEEASSVLSSVQSSRASENLSELGKRLST